MELHSLHQQQLLLDVLEAWLRPGATAPLSVDYPVPWNRLALWQCVQGIANLASVARKPRQSRHLPIGGNSSVWDAFDDRVDAFVGIRWLLDTCHRDLGSLPAPLGSSARSGATAHTATDHHTGKAHEGNQEGVPAWLFGT